MVQIYLGQRTEEQVIKKMLPPVALVSMNWETPLSTVALDGEEFEEFVKSVNTFYNNIYRPLFIDQPQEK